MWGSQEGTDILWPAQKDGSRQSWSNLKPINNRKLSWPLLFIRQPQRNFILELQVLFFFFFSREKLFKYVIGSGNQDPKGLQKQGKQLP